MSGSSIGDIPSEDERLLNILVQRVAYMLYRKELPARTDVLLRHTIKRRTWPWGTTIALTSRKSDDKWFEFLLLDSNGKETETLAYVSNRAKVGIADDYGLVTSSDGVGDDHATWLASLQAAIDHAPVQIFREYHGVV